MKTQKVLLPARGRSKQQVEIEVAGVVVRQKNGGGRSRLRLDSSSLRGKPLQPLIDLGARYGFDPAEMLAQGLFAMQREAAKNVRPSLQKQMVALTGSEQEARLGAMHLRKLAHQLHVPEEKMLEAVEHLKEQLAIPA